MTVPTQAQLHDEVDRLYHERHSDAPYQLDPDDPDHRPWVERWLEIRDDVVNDWTNDVFFSYFAGAGKLDPNDPADADMIACWLDIRDQIRDDAPARIDIAAVAAAAHAGSGEQEGGVPQGEVEVIVQDPPAPTSWEDETIVDRIFDAQLTALAQWDAALDMFDEVVEASADDETTPSFTNVARDYFVEKVVGLLAAEIPGGGEVVAIWKRLTAEVDRARSADASAKMRDFLVDQHAQVAAFVKAIDEAREDLMPEVQRLAYGANAGDAAAAAEYDVVRPAIVDLAVAAMALRDAADPQTYFQVLVEKWLDGSSYRDDLGKPAGLRIDLHADFTIRSASLTGPHAEKLGDQLEKMNRDDGIDLLAVRVPKFIRYAEQDDRWYAYLQVDADNRLEWLELGMTGDGGDDGERQGWLHAELQARGLPRVSKLD